MSFDKILTFLEFAEIVDSLEAAEVDVT